VWDEDLGAPESLTDFVEQAVLGQNESRTCLVLDEADRVFQYKLRNAFFATIRAWHNRRAMNPAWNRLNILIGHSTEPALFIDDINQSPFNVGEVFRLCDFARAEVEMLNQIHQWPLRTGAEVDALVKLVGGQPYLVRQALYTLRTGIESIEALERVAADDDGPFGDHLRRHLWRLRDRDRLRKALKRAIHQGRCEDEEDFQRLRAAGLVAGESREAVQPRCEIYRRYFTRHL
jgi:hypothetical protein